MSLQASEQLGPYEIVSPLGAGGMGEVYRARDPRLERDVAIKILPDRVAADAEALARFQREAKAVAALAHPNILAVYDVGAERGVTYLVMELLEGQTLRERIRRTRAPWRKAVEQAIGIADGLTAAHAKGIVHRDLKPDNIFITTSGVVKILDFGLAEAAKRVTPRPVPTPDGTTLTRDATPSPAAGTLGYMSPEQIRGEAVDARSDIFAFGCVLYEVLTGRRTFAGETAADTMSATLKDYPPAPTATGADIPPELERIVMRCLEKDPQDRFFSAHDLAIALRDVLADSGRYQPAKATSRRRWIAPTIAAVGLAVMALMLALNPGGLRERLWAGASDALVKSDRSDGTPAKVPSLAVLPFANDSGDEELVYLSDGIAETLINGFSRLEGLNTIPRSSAFRHRGKDVDCVQAGRQLFATAVLSGRVLKRGEDLTIQAELVDVAEARQLWGDRYQRKFADLVEIERDIAREITDALRLRLTGEQKREFSRGYSENTEAYQLYLQGRFWWNKRTKEGFENALRLFNRAVEFDPDFALAHAGIADTYSTMPVFSLLAPREALPKARSAAENALRLDPGLAEAHASMGMVRFFLEWDFKSAERDFERAIKLNPRYATAHLWWGMNAAVQDRTAEGRAELSRAIELDPLVPISHHLLGWVQYWERDYEGALARHKTGLEFAPEFPSFQTGIGMTLLAMDRYDEAIAHLRTACTLPGVAPFAEALLGYALARTGHEHEARALLAEGLELRSKRHLAPTTFAFISVGLGEFDEAFDWLEKAYEVHDTWLVFLGELPTYDPLRSDPRFDSLLRRIGLDPAAYPKLRAAKQTAGKIASLAVLPLENMSRDPDQDYFADGMTEALISDLAKIGGLKVISRTSVMRYKGTTKSLPEIAKELNVDAVVEGSVLRVGDRVRITAQLIRAVTDEHLWTESYDRDLSDVLRLQSEVARTIAKEIKVTLAPQVQTRVVEARSVKPEAYQAYLQGRFFYWNKATSEGYRKSIQFFQEAVRIDPDFALAHAGIADAYANWGGAPGVSHAEAQPIARAAADRALGLDDQLAEAHAANGHVAMFLE
jgi:TolB-like protein/Tfp pilus assembly protein PilF